MLDPNLKSPIVTANHLNCYFILIFIIPFICIIIIITRLKKNCKKTYSIPGEGLGRVKAGGALMVVFANRCGIFE